MNVLHKTDSIVPEFLSGMGEDLKRGLVPLRVFNNREIHELELRRIFARSWVFIAHQTEIPNPGDFVTRPIGEDPFICVRDDEGAIHVLLNSCRHRGAQLCRVEMGNTRGFTCPFHGWSYKTNGELVGVPARRQAQLAARHRCPESGRGSGILKPFGEPDSLRRVAHVRLPVQLIFMLFPRTKPGAAIRAGL